MFKKISVISLLLLSSLAHSASLSLSDAVLEGVQNSPVVQKAESERKQATWRKRENLNGFLPALSATATYLTDHKYVLTNIPSFGNVAVPGIVPTSNFVINASLPLFEGGASYHKYRAGSALEDAAEHNWQRTRFKTSREILLQYYRVVAAVVLKQVAEQNLKTLSDHQRDVKLFKKAGISTNFDVLQVEVKQSEAESEVLNATDNVEIQRQNLNTLLGRESDFREISSILPELPDGLLEKKNLEEFKDRDDVAALAYRAEAYRHLDSAAGSFWVPHLSLFTQYQHYNNLSGSFYNDDDFRDAYMTGLQLTWNIFDGMTSISRSQISDEERYQAKKDLQLAQLNARKDLNLWRRKFNYQTSVFKSRKSDVAKSEESVRLATQGRKVGIRTNSDLLDAESELFRARAGMVNAQIGSIEALVNLEFAVGHELYNFY